MRNLFFFEKLLILGGILGIGFLLLTGHASIPSLMLYTILVVGFCMLYVWLGMQQNDKALAAVAHANNAYTNAFEGTGIGIAYAKASDLAAFQVYANGHHRSYRPYELRAVGLKEDRKGVYRNLLLQTKDGNRPEWIIHFKNSAEAKAWKERITQFCEERGGE